MGLPAPNLIALARRLVTTWSMRERSQRPTTGPPSRSETEHRARPRSSLNRADHLADERPEVDVAQVEREPRPRRSARRRGARRSGGSSAPPCRSARSTSLPMACGLAGAARLHGPDAWPRARAMSDVIGVLSSWEATVRNSSRTRTASWAGAVEPGVVDGDRRPARHLLHELEIGVGRSGAPARPRRGSAPRASARAPRAAPSSAVVRPEGADEPGRARRPRQLSRRTSSESSGNRSGSPVRRTVAAGWGESRRGGYRRCSSWSSGSLAGSLWAPATRRISPPSTTSIDAPVGRAIARTAARGAPGSSS